MARACPNEHQIVRSDLAGLPIEDGLDATVDEHQGLISIVVNLLADLAAGRDRHHDDLLVLTGDDLPTEGFVRPCCRHDVHAVDCWCHGKLLTFALPTRCAYRARVASKTVLRQIVTSSGRQFLLPYGSRGNVGSCLTTGGAAGARAGNGDTSAAGTVGCIGGSAGSGDTSAVASVGSCPAGGGTPEPEDSGTGSAGGGGGGGELGEGASGGESGPLGSLARMASGNLPLTGLPVWLVLLAGLTALTIGAFLYRRRAAAADLATH